MDVDLTDLATRLTGLRAAAGAVSLAAHCAVLRTLDARVRTRAVADDVRKRMARTAERVARTQERLARDGLAGRHKRGPH